MSDACSNSQGFGRRGASRGVRTVVATSGIQPRKAALPAGGKADASGEYFVAKFKLVTVLVASGLFLGGLLALPEFWAPPDPHAPKIVSLTPYDWEMFLGATIGLTLIGAMFLVKGLLRGRALVMTDSHVAIFTIVGTKRSVGRTLPKSNFLPTIRLARSSSSTRTRTIHHGDGWRVTFPSTWLLPINPSRM